MALVCLVVVLGSVPGCRGNGRKAALTEEEIERLTYAPKPDRPDEIVVNGVPITYDEILAEPPDENPTAMPFRERLAGLAKATSLEQFRELARPQIQQKLNGRISNVALSARARRELGDKVDNKLDDFTERELRRFIFEDHNGNDAHADAALQKAGMNRATYKEWKKKQLLAQYVIEAKYPRNRPITYGELLARYNALKDTQYVREGVLQLRLIDIDVARVKLADPNDDPLQKARGLAQELRKRIEAGEDFAGLAKQHSDDPLGRQGGLMRPRDPQSLAAPYDVLAQEAENTERGQVAGPIEAPGHVFLMKVEEKQERGYQPLEEVQEELKKDITDRRRREVLEELDAEVAQQAALADTSRFVDYCLQRIYREAQ